MVAEEEEEEREEGEGRDWVLWMMLGDRSARAVSSDCIVAFKGFWFLTATSNVEKRSQVFQRIHVLAVASECHILCRCCVSLHACFNTGPRPLNC